MGPILLLLIPSSLLLLCLLSILSILLHLHLTNSRKRAALLHIPNPTTPHPSHPLYGDMLHWGPMAPPFHTAAVISAAAAARPSDPLLRYSFYLGEPRLMCATPAAAADVMRRARLWVKPVMTREIMREAVGGDGLLLAEGNAHARLRRLFAPLFHAESAAEKGPIMREYAVNLAKQWRRRVVQGEGGGVGTGAGVDVASVYGDVSLCSMGIIGVIALGVEEESKRMFESYRAFLEGHANLSHLALLITFFAPQYAASVPLPEIRQSRKLLKQIKEAINAVVSQRRIQFQKCDDEAGVDFLAQFLAASDPGEAASDGDAARKLSDGEVVAAALTFMAAGHATTSAGICWLLFNISANPRAQEELRIELFEAFPTGILDSADLNFEGGVNCNEEWVSKLNSLPLLDATVRESLRLTPAVNMTARETLDDTEVAGVPVPRGTIVSIPIQALNRLKSSWGPDANHFRPRRWLETTEKGTSGRERSAAWLTFLHGPRSCIGAQLALLEMKVVCAAVLLEGLKLTITPGCEPGALGVILVPKNLSLRVSLGENA